MATLSIRIPGSVHTAVKNLAIADDVSINQFINSAISEKIAAYNTENYIKTRAERASKENFLEILDKVPD